MSDKIAAAKARLRYLNRPGILGGSGMPSSRNLDKPYRPVRVVDNAEGTQVHPLDMMRQGAKPEKFGGIYVSTGERQVNTTGCFGDVSTFQGVRVNKARGELPITADPDRAGRISVVAGLPGKSASGRRRKKSGVNGAGVKVNLAVPKNLSKVYDGKVVPVLLNLRNDILTVLMMGWYMERELVDEQTKIAFEHIESYLERNCDARFIANMYFKDSCRESSIKGQIESGNIQVKPIRDLSQRIAAALTVIKAQAGRNL